MAKQNEIPGTESDIHKIPAVHKAAKAYAEIRDQRIDLNKHESALKGKLITLMKKHDLDQYGPVDGVIVTLSHGEDTIKVKVVDDSEAA